MLLIALLSVCASSLMTIIAVHFLHHVLASVQLPSANPSVAVHTSILHPLFAHHHLILCYVDINIVCVLL